MTVNELNTYLKNADYPERFKAFQPFIFEWEIVANNSGVILVENDPSDPGGATFCGLDKASHPDLNFKAMSPKNVCDTYLNKYWNKFGVEHYPYPLGEAFYNCCVNAGVGRANKILATGARTATAFIEEQENFYKRLAAARPSLNKFLKGWLNRTSDLKRFLNV